MLKPSELEKLLDDLESDQVERKASTSDMGKINQAVCAFANDMPGHKTPGYLFVGVGDDGVPTGLDISDRLLQKLSDMATHGRISPRPSITVEKINLKGTPVAVVEVQPADMPPVRFEGRIWIRIGSRLAQAGRQDERILTERHVFRTMTFDRRPCVVAKLDDLILSSFRQEYLPQAVARETIEENDRDTTQQLASLRFYDHDYDAPTNAGVLVFGVNPQSVSPGSYVQFVRYQGEKLDSPILDSKEISGNLLTQLQQIDNLLPVQIQTARTVPDGIHAEEVPDYPRMALRELIMNAVMHRVYEETNTPVRINWFSDRVEIQNPGGLYGSVTRDNFRHMTDYRNPILAEVMKTLGYVERFGVGIARAEAALEKNGNPPAEFTFEQMYTSVVIRGVGT